MSGRAVIQGFSYQSQREEFHTRAEWRELLGKVIAAGGRRRAEAGETFAHTKDAGLAFEVYAIIPAPGAPSPEE